MTPSIGKRRNQRLNSQSTAQKIVSVFVFRVRNSRFRRRLDHRCLSSREIGNNPVVLCHAIAATAAVRCALVWSTLYARFAESTGAYQKPNRYSDMQGAGCRQAVLRTQDTKQQKTVNERENEENNSI